MNISQVIGITLVIFLSGCASFFSPNPHQSTPLISIKDKETQKLVIKWTLFASKSIDKRLSSSFPPIYHEGLFYTAWPNGRIEIINAITGRFSEKLIVKKTEFTTAPAIDKDILFFGTTDTQIIAWNKNQKKEIWRNSLSSLLLEPPLIVGDIVIAKTSDGHISGFNAKDGTLKYHNNYVAPNFMIRNQKSLSLLDKSIFLLGMPSGYLYIVDAKTGYKLLQIPVGAPRGSTEFERAVDIINPPIVAQNLLYTTAYLSKVICFDLNTTTRQWSADISTYQPIALSESRIIVSTEDSILVALDSKTGKEIWRLNDLRYRHISAPAILDGVILVVDQAGIAHLIDPNSGQLVGRRDIGMGALLSPPESFGQGVLLQNYYGQLAYIALKK